MIGIARPTGDDDDPLAIGIAGRGFDGNLTSDSTRTDGYVLATDVAPTVLDWLGLGVPSQMSGQPIRSEGEVDVAAIESLGARMAVISHRRGPVIGCGLLVWLGLLALAVLAGWATGRAAPARVGVRLVGLAVVYMPLVLLAGAALEPGEGAEALLVTLAAPALAALTLAALRGYRALAVAAGLTVLAYAVDAIAGSPLSSLSLLGPNPGLGVRFYGIGNELEALLAVLVVAGCGAGLAGFGPRLPPRRAAAGFLVGGLLCAFVFAAGRFGADVGAAIVFPVGAAVAALAVAGRSRRAVVLVVAAPFAVLALLALVDLRLRRQRPPDPLGARRRRAERARRRRPAPAAALGPQLRPPDPPLLPAAGRGAGRAGDLEAGPAARLDRRLAGLRGRPDRRRRGHRGRHPGQRFRRPAARDRHRVSAGFRGLCLG